MLLEVATAEGGTAVERNAIAQNQRRIGTRALDAAMSAAGFDTEDVLQGSKGSSRRESKESKSGHGHVLPIFSHVMHAGSDLLSASMHLHFSFARFATLLRRALHLDIGQIKTMFLGLLVANGLLSVEGGGRERKG